MTEEVKATKASVPKKYQHEYQPRVCVPREVEGDNVDEATGAKKMVTIEPTHDGTITVLLPTYDERMALSGLGDISVGPEDTEESVTLRATAKTANASWLASIIRRIDPFVLEVNLKRKSDGFVLDCMEDLRRDSDMTGVLQELAIKLVSKLQVGNSL